MTDPAGSFHGAGDVFTIGHSTHDIETFVSLLQRHRIVQVVDVRTIPRSRRNPQYDGSALQASLGEAGIAYAHVPAVGGLRKPRPDSTNDGWEVAGFRGYADYMATPAFAEGLDQVMALAASAPTSSGSALASPEELGFTAIMCAEAFWRRCHRRLLSDALTVAGWRVYHILPGRPDAEPHALTPFLVVENGQIAYPAAQLRLG